MPLASISINIFDQTVEKVKNKALELLDSKASPFSALQKITPISGVYLIIDGDTPLYAGRSNNIRMRLQYHSRNSHNQATLAFLLARKATGLTKASYTHKNSRKDLLENNEKFRRSFDNARQKIKKMAVKYINENDPLSQAMLEICVAQITKATYSDFRNH